jgi:hypothetical protein
MQIKCYPRNRQSNRQKPEITSQARQLTILSIPPSEVLEWWRVTSEAINRERARSQVTKLPVIFQDLEVLLDVIHDSHDTSQNLKTMFMR